MALIDSLKGYFGTANVIADPVRSGLFCCYKKNRNGTVYQVIHVDCSDAWLQDGLDAYFEDILSQQYYTSEAYLQWNFYYYFIADDTSLTQHQDIKNSVENNEAFARKFVVTEAELVDRFRSTDNIGRAGGQLDGEDLYTEWLNYLRDNELHFIYDDRNYPNYKSWVDQYMEGRPFLPPADTSGLSSTNAAPRISFLSNLDIDNFRALPVLRTFEFGQVNLISGANATGKTSFFDILEFCLTGKAKGADGEGYRLRITTADDQTVPYPDAPTTYKQRDISWYKSVNTRGHNLPNNFNKFNYFSSDAAFVLKAEDDRGENLIERTMTDIAVGRDISRLEERVSEFRSRFDAQHDTLRKTSEQLTAELENLTRNAVEVQAASTDSTVYRSAVTRYLADHKWHIAEGEDEDFIAAIAAGVELVNNSYQDLLRNLPSSGAETPTEIESEVVRLTSKANDLIQLRDDLNAAQRLYDQLKDSIGKMNTAAEAVGGLKMFFGDPDFALLPIIDDELKSAEAKVNLVQKAGECLTGLAIFMQSQPVGTGSSKLMDYGQLQLDRRQQAQTDRQSAAALAETIRESVDELTRLISDIKRLGSEYLTAFPAADHCPLCDTPLRHEIIADRVRSAATRLSDSDQYRLCQEEIRRQELTIADLDRILEEIDRFESLIPHQYMDAIADKTLDELQIFWEKELTLLPEAREQFSRLRRIRERFDSTGITIQNFRKIQDDLNTLLRIKVESGTDLENSLTLIQLQLETLNECLRSQAEFITEIQVKTGDVFEPANPDEFVLASNLRKWREAKAALTNLRSITTVDDDSPIIKVHTNVLGLTSVFTIYKDHWYAQKTRTDALELITRSRHSVEERRRSNQAKMERVSSIIEKLDHLLVERSKMQYLTDFVAGNKQEIVGIFRLIHSPVEFEDISFEDNKIKLKNRAGDWQTINEVSTGQRTAVALSLFLSLNKKLSDGPNIIMMDDPVTYVDDLNTLSFFDYLRELVEQSGRQVFFATANADVAFLFAKKFSYLGSSAFKRFELKREIQ